VQFLGSGSTPGAAVAGHAAVGATPCAACCTGAATAARFLLLLVLCTLAVIIAAVTAAAGHLPLAPVTRLPAADHCSW
jgi:hypothetical protein